MYMYSTDLTVMYMYSTDLTVGASSAYNDTQSPSTKKSLTLTIPSGRSLALNRALKQSRIFFHPSLNKLPWQWASENSVSRERRDFKSVCRTSAIVKDWGCSWGCSNEVNLLNWIIRLSKTSRCSYWAAIDAHSLQKCDSYTLIKPTVSHIAN